MMFEGYYQQALHLHSLNENGTIILGKQQIPHQVLNAISSTVKSEGHFWHFQYEILSNVQQLQDEATDVLSTRITSLINNFKFPNQGDHEDHASTVCSGVPQSLHLDPATGPAATHLPALLYQCQLLVS